MCRVLDVGTSSFYGVGLAVTGACMAVTFGAGAPGCMALGGAASGLTSAVQGCQTWGAACARQAVIGAISGSVAGLVGGFGTGTLVRAVLGGAAGAGGASAIGQFLLTGHVD